MRLLLPAPHARRVSQDTGTNSQAAPPVCPALLRADADDGADGDDLENNSEDLTLKIQMKSSASNHSKGVIQQIPDSCRQDIVQANLKLHNIMQKMNTLSVNSITEK